MTWNAKVSLGMYSLRAIKIGLNYLSTSERFTVFDCAQRFYSTHLLAFISWIAHTNNESPNRHQSDLCSARFCLNCLLEYTLQSGSGSNQFDVCVNAPKYRLEKKCRAQNFVRYRVVQVN